MIGLGRTPAPVEQSTVLIVTHLFFGEYFNFLAMILVGDILMIEISM